MIQSHSQTMHFIPALLISLMLVVWGVALVLVPGQIINSGGMMITGVILVLGGLFMASARVHWLITVSATIIGLYFCARASGVIELPWLARIIGVACFVVATGLIYRTWPGRRFTL